MKASLRLFLNGFHIPGWNPLPSPTQPPVQEVLLADRREEVYLLSERFEFLFDRIQGFSVLYRIDFG